MRSLVEQPVVLAVGARPADADLVCAGTLALLRQRGWRVVLASISAGESVSHAVIAEAATELRRAAARDAAKLLDGEFLCLDVEEYAIAYGDELCRQATALVRSVHPAVVLTHGPQDPTPDMEQTGRIVRQACLAAPVQRYATNGAFGPHEPTPRIPHLYYFDPVELIDAFGKHVEAGVVVDVAATFEMKAKVLAHHAQPTAGGGQDGALTQMIDDARVWAQRRGNEVGCALGEGFRQHLGPAFPRDDLLGQVLGPLARRMCSSVARGS